MLYRHPTPPAYSPPLQMPPVPPERLRSALALGCVGSSTHGRPWAPRPCRRPCVSRPATAVSSATTPPHPMTPCTCAVLSRRARTGTEGGGTRGCRRLVPYRFQLLFRPQPATAVVTHIAVDQFNGCAVLSRRPLRSLTVKYPCATALIAELDPQATSTPAEPRIRQVSRSLARRAVILEVGGRKSEWT